MKITQLKTKIAHFVSTVVFAKKNKTLRAYITLGGSGKYNKTFLKTSKNSNFMFKFLDKWRAKSNVTLKTNYNSEQRHRNDKVKLG